METYILIKKSNIYGWIHYASLVGSLSIVENDDTCSIEDRNRCTREDTFGQRYHIDHVTLRHWSLPKIDHCKQKNMKSTTHGKTWVVWQKKKKTTHGKYDFKCFMHKN